MRRLPNFIIGGAARSGTTWLCHLLERHPQIGLARPIVPEPKFFLVDDLFAKGLDHYASRWFGDLAQPVLGEKSTNYLDSGMAAARIAAALPEVRLVFMLRDPVERTFSNYRWSRRQGHETEDFAAALGLEGTRTTPHHLRFARPFDYLSRSRYLERLQPYLDLFAAEKVLLLRFEDIILRPEVLAARLHSFLGVAQRPRDAEGLGVINDADAGEMLPETRRWLADYFSQPDLALARRTGFDTSAWTSQKAGPEL